LGKGPPPTESNLPEIWTGHSLAGPDRDILGRPAGVCCTQLRGHAPSNCQTPDRHCIHPTTADFTSRAYGAATDPAQDPGRGYDPFVNWAAVGRGEVTAAIVEYARMGLAGVVPPCLESPRTRAKWFHAALRRVIRATGRPVHVWEYRSHD